ncbi:MAG: hypothetical protein L6R41_001402 [Letrouitia leprolyta]|nr:MAG: hypothetical protein L6R41_001402 [Letrouitia leprolyta]
MSTEHAPTARTRERPSGDEEASADLRLGEFQNVPTLTLSEARLLINAVMDHRKSIRKIEETDTLVKTQDYLDVFARFKQKENIEAVERMLGAKQELELFERSQLGSLCCETAEEAKTLIPSLANKINDQDLQELLDDITKLRHFVE